MSLSSPRSLEIMTGDGHERVERTLWDREGSLKRLGGNETLLSDLAQVFCEDAPGLLDRLKEAVDSQDKQLILRSAHALRGLASNFGADALMHPLRELEDGSRQGEMDEAPTFLNEAELQTNRLVKELGRYC